MSNPIYDQYIAYYNDCSAKIHDIDLLPIDQRNQPNVVSDRATIVAQQSLLFQVYQKDYNTTLDQYITDCTSIETTVQSAYNNAMGGGSSIQQAIYTDYTNATTIASSISSTISQDAPSFSSPASLQNTISALQNQINALPDGAQKTQAQSDLDIAMFQLNTLTVDVNNATAAFNSLQTALANINGTGGLLAQLQALTTLANPQQSDLDAANSLLDSISSTQANLQAFQTGPMASIAQDLNAVLASIKKVQREINPKPVPGQIENACWYIDWNSWTFPVPQNVNMVNLFVGKLALDSSGNPTINGFGNIKDIAGFVQQCNQSNPPIAVKASIGGGGGTYDNCWDVLTPDNIDSFASAMVSFCKTNGLAGIDFDYEEYKGPEQEALVGQLIAKFKGLAPDLQATLCTNAYYGSGSPWVSCVQNICNAAVDPNTSKCLLDRLYVMSYYQPVDQEQTWLAGWVDFMKTTYGFSPAQITVGIDDTDAHAYDIGALAKWAGEQGMSTGYWYFNPANPNSSNQSLLAIMNGYNSSQNSLLAKTAKVASCATSYIAPSAPLAEEAFPSAPSLQQVRVITRYVEIVRYENIFQTISRMVQIVGRAFDSLLDAFLSLFRRRIQSTIVLRPVYVVPQIMAPVYTQPYYPYPMVYSAY